MNSSKRLHLVDTWRGFAVLGMVIYHIAFMMADLLGSSSLYSHPLMQLIGDLVRTSFLFLVGVSLSLSYANRPGNEFRNRQLKRGMQVLLCALTITIASSFYSPERVVYFGILHSIAFAILVLHPFVKHPRKSFLIAVAILLLFFFLGSFDIRSPYLSIFYRSAQMMIRPLDHFAIIPSWSAILFGITFGYAISVSKKMKQIFEIHLKYFNWVTTCGKHALLIYMLHIPVVYLLVRAIDLLS